MLWAWEEEAAQILTVDIVNYTSGDFLCISQAFLPFIPSLQNILLSQTFSPLASFLSYPADGFNYISYFLGGGGGGHILVPLISCSGSFFLVKDEESDCVKVICRRQVRWWRAYGSWWAGCKKDVLSRSSPEKNLEWNTPARDYPEPPRSVHTQQGTHSIDALRLYIKVQAG